MGIKTVAEGSRLENDSMLTKNDKANMYNERWKTITHSLLFPRPVAQTANRNHTPYMKCFRSLEAINPTTVGA